MTINHHVDLVIKFIDSFTDKPLINSYETFTLNGFPITPTKKMTPYVVFTNILNNHHYAKYGDHSKIHQLMWQHPFYETITIELEATKKETSNSEYLIRAIPNRNYPYLEGITAITGVAHNSNLIEIVHEHSRNRFLLKSSIVAGKYIEMSQSNESELLGRKFIFSEKHHDQIVVIDADNIGNYGIPNFDYPYTPECDIFEIIEAVPQPDGKFILPIKNLKSTDEPDLELKMNIHSGAQVKSTVIKIKKDVINDVGEF